MAVLPATFSICEAVELEPYRALFPPPLPPSQITSSPSVTGWQYAFTSWLGAFVTFSLQCSRLPLTVSGCDCWGFTADIYTYIHTYIRMYNIPLFWPSPDWLSQGSGGRSVPCSVMPRHALFDLTQPWWARCTVHVLQNRQAAREVCAGYRYRMS